MCCPASRHSPYETYKFAAKNWTIIEKIANSSFSGTGGRLNVSSVLLLQQPPRLLLQGSDRVPTVRAAVGRPLGMSSNHDNEGPLQGLINARISERLNFLDPELEATHSRIDVLETICQANTDRIEAISKHQSKTDRGESSIMDFSTFTPYYLLLYYILLL